MKTLKYEEVYLFEYEDFAEAKRRVGQFLDRVYNEKRLHSALGYLPPVEYEQSVLEQARACLALPCMLFGNEPPPRGESSAGAAPTLRYGPAGDSAPRLRLVPLPKIPARATVLPAIVRREGHPAQPRALGARRPPRHPSRARLRKSPPRRPARSPAGATCSKPSLTTSRRQACKRHPTIPLCPARRSARSASSPTTPSTPTTSAT